MVNDALDDWVAATREIVVREGPGVLAVDDLATSDLGWLEWAGGRLHVEHVAAELERVARGEVDYLVIRSPSGPPVSKGGVDYADPHGTAKLWQLATHPELRSLGIGRRLIAVLEQRISARGYESATLGVEVDNPRARALYERLGYEAYDVEQTGWDQQDERGNVYRYETECVLMRKTLRP